MKHLKNFLIKREQSQARLRFAKCEKSRLLARTILTLVALFAMTAGAWADVKAPSVKPFTVPDTWQNVNEAYTATDLPADFADCSDDEAAAWAAACTDEQAVLIYSLANCYLKVPKGSDKITYVKMELYGAKNYGMKIYYTVTTGTPVPLTWDAATPNTATLTNGMPAGNVTVSVDYFAQAEFAKSTDPTPVELAPAAIANVPANTDAPIVTPGTVANIGTSEVPQGTLKYFVKQATDNTVPTAPDYDTRGWSENVPTANDLKQGDVYVWYYIEGAEPDNIAERTDDNTRSDSDIMPLGTTGIVTLDAEPTYDVTLNADGLSDEEAAAWKVAKGTDDPAAFPLEGVKKGETVTVTYTGSKKVIGVKAEKPVTLATPLTIEAVTPGTIVVNMTGTLTSGMKYSVNGGTTKTLITESRDIPVAKGDKVQFYGNGTQTQAYYIQNGVRVSINGSGDGFQTKVYGNIMSLLDETGFATKTDLPNEPLVFSGLFAGNTTLIDASELLLPATTLAPACYSSMFYNCTSLTTAPKLPATTLATQCYTGMFYRCTSLTSAYVKAAYTEERFSCRKMFDDCTATGAVLHTTSDNKASWENMMGSGKTWENWTVADDWQE